MGTMPPGRVTPEDLARQRLEMLNKHLEILRRLNAPEKAIKSAEEELEERRRQLDRYRTLHA